jgi:hypothetical protein
MAYPYTRTRNQIVNRALRLTGTLAQGEEPTPEQQAESIEALNLLLMSLANDGVRLWKHSEELLPLTPASEVLHNAVSYKCIYPHGSTTVVAQAVEPGVTSSWQLYWRIEGTSTTPWANNVVYHTPLVHILADAVIGIDQVWYARNDPDNPVEIQLVDKFEFNRLNSKGDPGSPMNAWVEQAESTIIHLDRAETETDKTLHFFAIRALDTFTTSGQTQDAPSQWIDAITYALAAMLADEYHLPLEERTILSSKAGTKIQAAKSANRETVTSNFIKSTY